MMPLANNLGSARICVNDLTAGVVVRCQTIDLSPGTVAPRRLVFVESGLNPAKNYRVTVRDVSGRAELDALVVLE